jgi:hypothetical protein
MKNSRAPMRQPNIEREARILKEEHLLAKGICRIWIPLALSERTVIEFEYAAPGIGSVPPPYRIVGEWPVGPSTVEHLRADGVWFEQIPQLRPGNMTRLTGKAVGVCELLVTGQKNDSVTESAPLCHVTFRLNHNPLLTPSLIVEQDRRRGSSAKTVRAIEVDDTIGHRFRFERQFDFADDGSQTSPATIVRSFLSATLATKIEGDPIDYISTKVLPSLQEILGLASFAARTDTRPFSWESNSNRENVRVFLGQVSPVHDTDDYASGQDELIDVVDLKEFIGNALRSLHGSDLRRAKLSRLAVLKSTSGRDEYAESKYLSLFAGLESILLLYREQESLEFTCSAAQWKKLEKAIRACVDDNAALFTSDFYREASKAAIPGMRRVPLGTVFEKFAAAYNISHGDIWPAFEADGNPSLATIRNRLIHGDLDMEEKLDSFITALSHLQALVERCCLAVLEWDWNRSEVSARALQLRTGFGREAVSAAMAQIK